MAFYIIKTRSVFRNAALAQHITFAKANISSAKRISCFCEAKTYHYFSVAAERGDLQRRLMIDAVAWIGKQNIFDTVE